MTNYFHELFSKLSREGSLSNQPLKVPDSFRHTLAYEKFKNSFFVYDLKKNSIEDAGLVAHGCGSDKGEGKLYFSNEINSGCTSLGKYKVGKAYTGRFGLAYKLYGLDSSNTNAIQRFVVLHAYPYVPYEEVAPIGICESRGCPMVAPAFLVVLKDYIDHTDKPILLWIFYEE